MKQRRKPGRPPKLEKPKTMSIILDQQTYQKLKRIQVKIKAKNTSQAIREIISRTDEAKFKPGNKTPQTIKQKIKTTLKSIIAIFKTNKEPEP